MDCILFNPYLIFKECTNINLHISYFIDICPNGKVLSCLLKYFQFMTYMIIFIYFSKSIH
jgi:hypothetical protein